MKFDEILYIAMKNKGFRNNGELFKYLGFSSSGFYSMKNGVGGLKDETVEKLMEATGFEAYDIEAAWKSSNSKNDKVRKSWQKFMNHAAGFFFVALLPINELIHQLYILCKINKSREVIA